MNLWYKGNYTCDCGPSTRVFMSRTITKDYTVLW